MGTASEKRPNLLHATPAERLDWLEGAVAEAYESGTLTPPSFSEDGNPFPQAVPPAAAKKRKRRKKRGDSSVAWELDRAGSPALAFVNSGLPRRDDRRQQKQAPPAKPLATYADAVRWAMRMDVVPAVVGETLSAAAETRPRDAAVAFAELETLRQALLRIFTAVVLKREVGNEDLAVLNGYLRQRGLEVFPWGDGFGRDWGGDGTDLDRLIWPLAESAAELLASKKLSRLRQCAAGGCLRLFVAANPRRRWCDANTCGSRDKGRRYKDMWRRADAAAARKTWRETEAERESEREAAEERIRKTMEQQAKLRRWLDEDESRERGNIS